ncbi:MFS transporter, partial [Sulfolobus sp. F1]
IGIIIIGIFNELALSVMYSIIALLQKGANTTVGLALVNSINILIGMNFQLIASYSGFYMWYVVNVIGILMLLLIFTVRRNVSV